VFQRNQDFPLGQRFQLYAPIYVPNPAPSLGYDSIIFNLCKEFFYSLNFRYAANTYEASEHVGTHIDAPFHFYEEGWKIGDIPLERFFVPGEYNFKKKKEFLN
jgi:hypothetical protein